MKDFLKKWNKETNKKSDKSDKGVQVVPRLFNETTEDHVTRIARNNRRDFLVHLEDYMIEAGIARVKYLSDDDGDITEVQINFKKPQKGNVTTMTKQCDSQ